MLLAVSPTRELTVYPRHNREDDRTDREAARLVGKKDQANGSLSTAGRSAPHHSTPTTPVSQQHGSPRTANTWENYSKAEDGMGLEGVGGAAPNPLRGLDAPGIHFPSSLTDDLSRAGPLVLQ